MRVGKRIVKPQGHAYKNITIRTQANVDTYNISPQYDLGLPKNALVYGIAYRQADGVNDFSINDRLLYGVNVLRNILLTLKDGSNNTILNNKPFFQERSVIYFEPKLSKELDWNRSTLFFPPILSNAGVITGAFDIEIIVLYYLQCDDENVVPDLIDMRSGRTLEGQRSTLVEVIEETGIQKYPIAPQSNIGIPEDHYLIGVDLSVSGRVVLSTTTFPNIGSAFLSISYEQNLVVDNFPISLVNAPKIDFEQNYTPIQPILAGSIDWERSEIFISRPADVINNASFCLNFIHVKPN